MYFYEYYQIYFNANSVTLLIGPNKRPLFIINEDYICLIQCLQNWVQLCS